VEQLLATKLFIPPTRPELVHRPRLIERLNESAHPNCKLTLISTPAGFGKTTLVSEWVQSVDGTTPPIAIAWLSLDEGDNDPARFLAYLIAALNQAGGSAAEIGKGSLSMLHSPQQPAAEAVLTPLINEIATISDRIILVLDDYHVIVSTQVDEALAFLLENLPPPLHLVVATREDPRLPLSRLRARGQLTELRAADLRFTASEAAEFINQVMGLDLSTQDIAALERRTEGWIAGLQLASLALLGTISTRGRKEAISFIKSFTGSNRLVLDYLIEEVLSQQAKDVQNFLLETAILDRLTGSLCDAVTGQENSQAILERLERANLFIIPLDEERRWYRYHHLFADLLRQRLRQTQPEELPILHIKAGQWYDQQGLKREAIRHLLAGRDYQGAAELISAIAIDIIQQGEHTTVAEWINAIPEAFAKDKPYLCVLHAWALQLTGQLETAEAHLSNAKNALHSQKYKDEGKGEADTILGLIHSRRAYATFMFGEHDQTISYAHQALDQLPETAALIRAQTALYLGIAYRYQGKLQEALDAYNELSPIIQKIDGISLIVLYYLHLGDLHTELAQLHRARELYEQALEFTERQAGRPDMPFSGYVYVSIGRILRQWNQLQDAYRFTTKGLALCRDWNVADILALSCIELAFTYQALGEVDQARASMQEAIQMMEGFSAWGVKYVAGYQAKLNIECGDLEAAERWAQANDLVSDGDFEFHREIEYLTLARLLIAQQQYEQAYTLAERICRIARETGKRLTELEGLILLALVSSNRGELDQALVYLEKALTIGNPEGFIRIFVDEGPPMARLLYEALAREIAPDYVRRLLAAFPVAETEQPEATKSQILEAHLVEPLSEREIEVLHLIAEGLTNQEIAARLYLSLNTVKVHTRNIYGKLDAHNRTQAVTRARALGILPST
jgi:LuxR family maltose regulon positive regulatory protein